MEIGGAGERQQNYWGRFLLILEREEEETFCRFPLLCETTRERENLCPARLDNGRNADGPGSERDTRCWGGKREKEGTGQWGKGAL